MTSRALGLAMLLLSSTASASDLPAAEKNQQALQNAARNTQAQVDKLTEQQIQQQAQLNQVKEETRNLTVYRDHLLRLIADQEQELQGLETQLQGLEQTRAGLVPLMYDMLAQLDTLLSQDLPLKAEQRRERLAELNQMMGMADVADAEKFRRLLEAFQIEMEYGRRLGLYRDTLDLGDTQREAEFLHLGRLSLIARSLDGQQYWLWQQDKWHTITDVSRATLAKAFAIAAGHQAPALLTLPVGVEIQ